jgi:hypothetical protein
VLGGSGYSGAGSARSRRSHIKRPDEPGRVSPLRLALHEGVAADRELIPEVRARDLARPHLEGCGLGVDAVSPKPMMVSGRRAITRTGIGSPPAGV